MTVERFFAPALEFADIMWQMQNAAGARRNTLRAQLRQSDYIQHLHAHQKFPQFGEHGKWTSSMTGSYFLNTAVPYRNTNGPGETNRFVSGDHSHTYFELILVLRGEYLHYVNGIPHRLAAGEACLLPPRAVHHEVSSSRPDRVLFCGIDPQLFQREILRKADRQIQQLFRRQEEEPSAQCFLTFRLQDERLRNWLNIALEEEMEHQPGYGLIVQGYLIRMLQAMTNGDAWQCWQPSRGETENRLLQQMLAYMSDNLTTVTKQQTADHFHFNTDYLGRLLLKNTGSTYSEILRYMKMRRACELLLTGLGVNEVIRQLGFSNKGYFYKIFKQTYGMLPGEYKEMF